MSSKGNGKKKFKGIIKTLSKSSNKSVDEVDPLSVEPICIARPGWDKNKKLELAIQAAEYDEVGSSR